MKAKPSLIIHRKSSNPAKDLTQSLVAKWKLTKVDSDFTALIEDMKPLLIKLGRDNQYLWHGDFDEAFSALSLTLLKASKTWKPRRGKWTTYFWTLIHNLIVNRKHFNSANKRQAVVVSLDSPMEDGLLTLQEFLPAPESKIYGDSEELDWLNQMIPQLNYRQRAVVELRLQGMTLKEIAKQLKISKQAVDQRAAKANRILRSLYSKQEAV